jgi:hypothetical protein
LNEVVTEVLIDCYDTELANKVAANKGARFSNAGFSKLVMLAEGDDRLTATISKRTDIPPRLFTELLSRATETVRRSLVASAPPETRDGLKKILNDISSQIGIRATSQHYGEAQRLVKQFSQDTYLTKRKLLEFAKAKKIEETVATLSVLSAVPIELIDRLVHSSNPYSIMVLCKVMVLYWPVTREIIQLKARPEGATVDLDELFVDYENMSPASAQLLLRFWQSRQGGATELPPRREVHLLTV